MFWVLAVSQAPPSSTGVRAKGHLGAWPGRVGCGELAGMGVGLASAVWAGPRAPPGRARVAGPRAHSNGLQRSGQPRGHAGLWGRAARSRAPGNGEGADPGPQSWGQLKMQRENGDRKWGAGAPRNGQSQLVSCALPGSRARWALGPPVAVQHGRGHGQPPCFLPALSRAGDFPVTPMRGTEGHMGLISCSEWGHRLAALGEPVQPPLPGRPHSASRHQRASGPAAPACFGGRLN